MANRIELSGLARSSERSTLGFETGGRISKLHVDVGDRFSRGQLLAELDVQPEQLRLEQARATLAAAEAALADRIVQTTQQRGLLEGNVISPAAFESVKAQLVAAEGQVRNAKAAFGLAERARRGPPFMRHSTASSRRNSLCRSQILQPERRCFKWMDYAAA
ncbi:biotin/lipoyl-binding protein [Enterobacter cloacae complex sp. 288G10]|uniref:biotin/lipoyl-binding protein n=1 Tax=Enterobacter cloacae complex sp. 288G10 TaxID=3395859 RepID=UPI003CFBB158